MKDVSRSDCIYEQTRRFLLLLLSMLLICGKEYLPVYTREHCKNVVTLTIGKLAFIVCMNVYLCCNSEEIPCSHFPRLCPLSISNGVDFHCGQ